MTDAQIWQALQPIIQEARWHSVDLALDTLVIKLDLEGSEAAELRERARQVYVDRVIMGAAG